MADAKIRLSVDGSSQVISEFSRVESKIGSLSAMADRAKQSLSVLGVGLGVNEIARLSDEYTKYTAQLKLATTSETQYASARAEVSRIAKASQSDLANTGTLYARIANGTRELGVTQQKVGEITEAVTLSLKASGATQAESASATLQLSQAFAAGALRGEEFNAVNEASPRLMKALADGLGVPVGALKTMASEGKITSQVMAETLPKALEDLRKEASQVETISGAMTNLKSSVMEMVGAQAQHNGTAALLSTTINTLANNLNYVTAAATGFTAVKVTEKIIDIVANTRASIIASNELAAAKARETAATIATAEASVAETSAKVAHLVETRAAVIAAREDAIAKLAVANASITAAQAQIQAATSAGALSGAIALLRQGEISLTAAMQARSVATTQLAVLGQQQAAVSAQVTAATAAQAAAQAGLGTATTAAAAGAGLLSRAVGFLGGPIGVITTLLGLGVTAWMAWGNSSEDANKQSQKATEESTNDAIARIGKEVEVLRERNRLRDAVPTVKGAREADLNALARAKKDYEDAQKGEGKAANITLAARVELLRTTGTAYANLINQVQLLADEQERVSQVAQNEKLKKWFGENGTQAQRMAAALEAARKEVGVLTPEMEKLIRAKFADKRISDELREENERGSAAANAAKKAEQEIAKQFATDLKEYARDQIAYTKEVTNEIVKNIEAQDKAYQGFKKSLDDQALAVAENNELAQLEMDLLGESNVVRATLIEQKKIELRLEKQIREIRASNLEEGQKNLLIDQAKAQALIEKSSASLQAEQKEWSKFYGEIYTGLSDSLYRSFESGKGFGKTFIDSIKNLFKTTVLKLAVQGVVTGILGMGTVGQANAMQAMGQSGNNPISMISAGKTMYEGFASGFSGFGDSVAKYVQAGLDKAGFHQTTMSASGNSAFATGAGTAASYLGGAAVGVYGGRALSGGYSVTGGNAAVNIGTLAGAIFGGPIGAAIGGLIGGGVNRLFGRKAAELQSSELSGTVGAGGFSASTRDVYVAKGGLFRSDKWSETNTVLPAESQKGLTAQYEAIKVAATGYASMLGLSASAVENYTKSFTFSLSKTGDAAKDAEMLQSAIDDLFSSINYDIANLLVPSISSFSKVGETASQTLGRLAMGLTSVNGVMQAAGFAEFAKSLDGANAAQRLIDLSGGIETLASGTQYFFENFLTDAEKIKPAADTVAETMARLGKPAVDTIEEFKLLVQGLDRSSQSGAEMYVELIKIAPQFKAVADYAAASSEELAKKAKLEKEAADAAQVAKAIAEERASLQSELNALTLSEVELAKLKRDSVNAANLDIYDQIRAVEAKRAADELATKALQEAAQVAKVIADERAGLQERLNALTLSEIDLNKIKRESINELNRDIYDQIVAIEAKKAADELATKVLQEAAQAAKVIADERAGLQAELNALTMTEVELMALKRETYHASNRELYDLVVSEKARQAAMAEAKAAIDRAASEEKAANQRRVDELKTAFSRESGVFRDVISQFTELAQSMKDYAESLVAGPAALLSPEAQYLANKAKFESVSAAAKTGDKDAIAQLRTVSDAFLESSRKYNASSQAYFADLEKVKAATSDATVAAYAQVDVAKVQLSLLEQQVAGLVDINDSVLTVADILSGKIRGAGGDAQQTAVGGYAATVRRDVENMGGLDALLQGAKSGDAYGRRNLQLKLERWNSMGLDQDDIDSILGEGWIQKFLEALNIPQNLFGDQINFSKYISQNMQQIPGFAKGGVGAGLMLVGEDGPELLNLGSPSRVINNRETNSLLSSKPDPEANRLMREQNALLSQVLQQLRLGDVKNVGKLEELNKGFSEIRRANDFFRSRPVTV